MLQLLFRQNIPSGIDPPDCVADEHWPLGGAISAGSWFSVWNSGQTE